MLPCLQDAVYQKLWGRFNAKTGLVETLDEDVEVVVPTNPSGVDDGGVVHNQHYKTQRICTHCAEDHAHGATGKYFTVINGTMFVSI